MQNKKEILDNLRQQGFRSTQIREAILDLMLKSNKLLSCQEIQKHLKLKANKTTFYRELQLLKDKRVIEELKLDDGVRRYEMSSRHHHHAVCIKCRKVKCVELNKDIKSQEKEVEKNNKFKIISHSLEFYGLCQKCQAVKNKNDTF
jgi:Fur family ferric uptake transcriptional regulator